VTFAPLAIAALTFSVAALSLLPVLLVEWPAADTRGWALLAYLGVFQIGLAYLLLTRGVRHVPAFEGALLLLLEPVVNPFWSWFVHGEVPGGWACAGAAVILVATVGATVSAARAQRPPPPPHFDTAK